MQHYRCILWFSLLCIKFVKELHKILIFLCKFSIKSCISVSSDSIILYYNWRVSSLTNISCVFKKWTKNHLNMSPDGPPIQPTSNGRNVWQLSDLQTLSISVEVQSSQVVWLVNSRFVDHKVLELDWASEVDLHLYSISKWTKSELNILKIHQH